MAAQQKATSVTREVLEKFLAELGQTRVDSDVTERLQAVLMNQARVSEKDLRQALFPSIANDEQ